MPPRDVLIAFTEAASARMAAPISTYYDIVDRYGADSTQALIAQAAARLDLERAVRENHVDAALIGAAGDLSDDARGILQEIVGTDTYYVERLADDLPSLSRGQAMVRANMYVSTQRNTITDIATLELPTLPIYPKDSRLDCQWHCKCGLNVVYLFGKGNYDVYWQLDVQNGIEHCQSCLRLAASWRPLKIRAGVIQGVKMIAAQDLAHIKMLLEVA